MEIKVEVDGEASSAKGATSTVVLDRHGHEALWRWFGLSYAGWLTLPRVMMHEMPDDWQQRMADLLREWDEAWDLDKLPAMGMSVTMKKGGRFAQTPEWLTNYRHPDREAIAALRSNADVTGAASAGTKGYASGDENE